MRFARFLGLNLCDTIPDAKTMWKFKNDLSNAEAMEVLFCLFDKQLENEGLISHRGTIVDVPHQRNSREEYKQIKNGEIPEEWGKAENAHKLAQKDTDAHWTKKNNEVHYGYKNYVKCDADSKLITNYRETDAAVHDSQRCVEHLENTDTALYADSAYSGVPIAENLPENCENHICEKGQPQSSADERTERE